MEELLKDKYFITKEYFEKQEPSETESEDFEYIKGKEKKKEKFIDPDKGKVNAFPAIENRVIGLYFSAGWCPPCQEFTPLLKALHEELESKKCPFQVVFISFDKKDEDMEEYYVEKHGEWLAVPFGDPLIEELKTKYEINAVPKLIIIKDDGEIITSRGRKEVQDRGFIGYRNWRQAASLIDGGTLNEPRQKKGIDKILENITEDTDNK